MTVDGLRLRFLPIFLIIRVVCPAISPLVGGNWDINS